jgi:hypothetical protein
LSVQKALLLFQDISCHVVLCVFVVIVVIVIIVIA